MLMSSPRSPVLPESPLDVLSRAASMVESASGSEAESDSTSPNNSSSATNPLLVNRSNSFKDLHPKFRRHNGATEYLSLADSIRAQKLGRQISLTTSMESVSPPVSPPTYPGPPVPLEPEAPLDFSIRKRSTSPVQPPPYKYSNPLRQHEPPLSRSSQSPPPSSHITSHPHLPVNPAPSYYRPPPYPRTPSPPPAPPSRPPPPSYEAAIAAKPISPRVHPAVPLLGSHHATSVASSSSAFISPHHPGSGASVPPTTSAFASLHPSSVPTTSPTFITLHPRPSPGRTADYSPPAKDSRNLDPNRPSVITSAGRRERSTEDKENKGHKREMTIVEETGACDLMEEHFRKSLGADYSKLFKEKKEEKVEKEEEEEKMEVDPVKAFKDDLDMSGYTVEDHFAKALGETWTKLQAKEAEKKEKKSTPSNNPKESKSQLLAL